MFDHRAMRRCALTIVPILLAGAVACNDTSADANSLVGPARITAVRSMSGPGSATCAASPTAVVTSEMALTAATAASGPGDVIAIDGTIVLTHEIEVRTGSVTLTCLQPGDGLAMRAAASPDLYTLLDIYAPNVTVQGLSLDARNTGYAIVAQSIPRGTDRRGVRIIGNDIWCGSAVCVFVIGPGALILKNTLISASDVPSTSGFHLQGGPDSARVEGNHVSALTPQGTFRFGAIRTVGGRDVVIRDNVITGPWSNGLALTYLQGGVVEGNSVSGAQLSGIYVAYGSNHTVSVRGVLVRGNISSAEGAALYVDGACGNVFVANRLSTTGTSPVAAFAQHTGANALLGELRGGVVDNGNVDCDGDGTVDPNMVSGTKRRDSTSPGDVIGSVMRNYRGIVIE